MRLPSITVILNYRTRAGVDDNFVNHNQYSDDVTYKVVHVAADMLGRFVCLFFCTYKPKHQRMFPSPVRRALRNYLVFKFQPL